MDTSGKLQYAELGKKMLINEDDVLELWKEYFEDLLNSAGEIINWQEGSDKVTVEMFKFGGAKLELQVHKLVEGIWIR